MAHISAQWWAQYVTAFYIGTGYNTETILWDWNYCGLSTDYTYSGLDQDDFDLFVRTALKGWYQAENNRIGQTVLFSVWRHEQPTLQLQMD